MSDGTANVRYKYLQKIGEGIHGMVLKAHDLTTDKMVAIKKVSLRTKYGDISLSTVREVKALQHCDCKYVSTDLGFSYGSFTMQRCQTEMSPNRS